MVPFRYNVRSLFVRKLMTFATAGGIAAVVFILAASMMLEEGVKRAIEVGGHKDVAIVLRRGSDAELSSGFAAQQVKLLGAHPQVSRSGSAALVSGELVIVITAERSDHSGGISNLTIRGLSEDGFALRPEFQLVSGRLPTPGTNEAVIGRAVSGRFLDPGTNTKVIEPGNSFDVRRNRPIAIVGVFSAGGSGYESEVWGDLDVLRRHMGREAVVSSARVRLTKASDFDAYKAAVERDPQLSLKVMREADYYADLSEQTSSFLTTMGFSLAVLFALAAMILAAITMNTAVANRSREIGTLRALGFGRFSILISFLLEAMFLAAIGGAIGSALAWGLSFTSFPILNFQTFSEIVIQFTASPRVFFSALIFAGLMGLIGGLGPAIRATRVSPVEAMRA